MKQRYHLILFVVVVLFLTACSQETDLYLREKENWELKTILNLNLNALPNIGGEFEGLDLNLNTGALSESALALSFDQIVTYCQSHGMEATWRSGRGRGRGETAYSLIIKGQGWDLLASLAKPDFSSLNQLIDGQDINQMWPIGLSVENLADGQIKFQMISEQDLGALGYFFPISFRLHGGKIISSNAGNVKGGTATWINPDENMVAVLTPMAGFSISPAVGFGFLIILIIIGFSIGLFILFSQNKTKRSARRAPVRRHSTYRR